MRPARTLPKWIADPAKLAGYRDACRDNAKAATVARVLGMSPQSLNSSLRLIRLSIGEGTLPEDQAELGARVLALWDARDVRSVWTASVVAKARSVLDDKKGDHPN